MALALCSATAQTQPDFIQCVRDGGTRVCIRTQSDGNVCGYGVRIFPGSRAPSLPCNDAVVEKFAADGRLLFRRVLAGESEDLPRQVAIDDRGRIVVLGSTWSSRFPLTPDAAQSRYAGPTPEPPSGGMRLGNGGDLFLTALSPSGEIDYSSYLGSPGNDEILAVDTNVRDQLDVLVRTPDLQFPVSSSPAGPGPVLLTVDIEKHAVSRAQYLPAADPGQSTAYAAQWSDSGRALVVVPGGVTTYSRDGRTLSRLSLNAPAFAYLPTVTEDSEGDLWLTGATANREAQLIRLKGATAEAFRWTVPATGDTAFASPPFFGPKGLVYLRGYLGYRGHLQSTTDNAILQEPCRDTSSPFFAVLDRDGDLKMLSYAPESPTFTLEKDHTVSATWDALNRVAIDLDQGPKIGCIFDALRSYSADPLGVGQLVRIRGSGFGGRSAVASLQSGRFPIRFDDVRVRIDGIDAAILASTDGEVIVSIPYGIRRDGVVPVTIQDERDRSQEFRVKVNVLVPKLLSEVLNEDGKPNTQSNPAAWGSTISFFMTGTGPYTPSLADGQVAAASPARRLEANVEVTWQITGPSDEAGEVVYAGPVTGLVGGLSRIVLRLPRARPFSYSSISGFLNFGTVRFALPSVYIR
jgi:uncharacterized protein (TIGR03437 family)